MKIGKKKLGLTTKQKLLILKDIVKVIDLPPNSVRKRLEVLTNKGLFTNNNGTYTLNLNI